MGLHDLIVKRSEGWDPGLPTSLMSPARFFLVRTRLKSKSPIGRSRSVPVRGGKCTGGIIRDVYLEVRSDPYIQNAHLQCLLNSTMDLARCGLDVSLLSTSRVQGKLTAELLLGATTVQHVDKE